MPSNIVWRVSTIAPSGIGHISHYHYALDEPLWLNKHIIANNHYIYDKYFEKKGISQLKDILDNRCEFLDHSALNHTYQLNTSFLKVLQIKSCIPTLWKNKLNQCTHMPKNIPKGNIIHINNKNITIEKTTCKDFYWHIINTDTYTHFNT